MNNVVINQFFLYFYFIFFLLNGEAKWIYFFCVKFFLKHPQKNNLISTAYEKRLNDQPKHSHTISSAGAFQCRKFIGNFPSFSLAGCFKKDTFLKCILNVAQLQFYLWCLNDNTLKSKRSTMISRMMDTSGINSNQFLLNFLHYVIIKIVAV